MRLRPVVLAVAATACLAGTTAAQNLLTDPGFEEGLVSDCAQALMPDTWQTLALTPDTYSFDCETAMGLGPAAFGNFPSLPAAHGGLRFAAGAETWDITPESFGQLVSGVVPGDLYHVSGFFARSDRLLGAGGFDVYMADAADPMNRVHVATIGALAVPGEWSQDDAEFVMPNLGTTQYIEFWPHAMSDPAECYIAADDLGLEWVGSVAVDGPGERLSGATLELASAAPVRGAARFGVTLPRDGAARVTVVDAGGRCVATLCDGARTAGRSVLTWDGTVHGVRAANGVYTAQLRLDGRIVAERRCLLVH